MPARAQEQVKQIEASLRLLPRFKPCCTFCGFTSPRSLVFVTVFMQLRSFSTHVSSCQSFNQLWLHYSDCNIRAASIESAWCEGARRQVYFKTELRSDFPQKWSSATPFQAVIFLFLQKFQDGPEGFFCLVLFWVLLCCIADILFFPALNQQVCDSEKLLCRGKFESPCLWINGEWWTDGGVTTTVLLSNKTS